MVISLLLTIRYSVGDRVGKPKARTAGSNSQGKNAPSRLFIIASVPRNPQGISIYLILPLTGSSKRCTLQGESSTSTGFHPSKPISPGPGWKRKGSQHRSSALSFQEHIPNSLHRRHAASAALARDPPWSTWLGSGCPLHKHLEPPGCWEQL